MPVEILNPDTPHPKRRASDHGPGDCPGGRDEILSVEQRLDEGDARMTRIEAKLDQNCIDTTEVLDILRMGKTFFRFAARFATAVKWLASLGAPVLMFWYAVKDWPKH